MAGKIRKAFGAMLLVLALVVTQIPSKRVTANESDFRLDGATLVKYVGNSEKVVIPDGIKVIGEEAFAGNTVLKEITFPSDLEEISYHAFYGCTQLESVKIPDKVEKIGNAAFAECVSLKQIQIGSGLKALGSAVFCGDRNLQKFEMSCDAYHVRGGVIYDKDEELIVEMLESCETTAFTMPSSVKRIEQYAFYDCDQLEYVCTSEYMEEIPNYAFYGCSGLKAVTIQYSTYRIKEKAFADCPSLAVVEIPASVNYIADNAFDGSFLANFVIENNSYAQQYANLLERSEIAKEEYELLIDAILENAIIQPDEEESSKEEAESSEEEGNTEENTENSEENNEQGSASNSETNSSTNSSANNDLLGQTHIVSGDAVIFVDNTKQQVYGSQYNSTEETEQTTEENEQESQEQESTENLEEIIPQENSGKGISFPKYTIVDNTIVPQAFYKQASINVYEFPENIENIGDFAFSRSGIEKAYLPDGVKRIGYGAFYHCDKLKEVSIPQSVQIIAPYAFEGTPWLSHWLSGEGEDFLIVGDGILLAYRGSSGKVQIPDGVRVIGAGCFSGHSGIVSVYIPQSVKIICEDAFSGCSNLSNVNGADGVITIEDRAFNGCPLTTVHIGEWVQGIGLRAFDTTQTVRRDDAVTVVFDCDILPEITYTHTSQRFYNEDYRDLAINGPNFALVKDETIILEGTILDPSRSGFRGVIGCLVTDENGERGVKILKICGNYSIPNEIMVNGSVIPVVDTSEDLSFGNEEAKSSASGGHVNISLRSMYITKPDMVEVNVSPVSHGYTLVLADDVVAENNIRDAYEERYGQADSMILHGFNLSMEDDLGIPITNVGKERIQIILPLSKDMEGSSISVVTMDENGQLELVSSEIIDRDGTTCISFYAKHFSPYGLMAFPFQTTDGTLDQSPDTGDYFEPKWVLCIGCVFSALVLFLWKGKKGTIK